MLDFHNIDYKNHSGEFGYWLDEDTTGKGYISDTLKIIENLLLKKGIVRLVIKCDIENIPSNKVAQKNEYVFEGTAKKSLYSYGKYKDVNVYAKTK